jgi:hypothetical protein
LARADIGSHGADRDRFPLALPSGQFPRLREFHAKPPRHPMTSEGSAASWPLWSRVESSADIQMRKAGPPHERGSSLSIHARGLVYDVPKPGDNMEIPARRLASGLWPRRAHEGMFHLDKGVPVALRVALFLLMCGLLFSNSDKSASADKAKCLAACQNKCDQSFASCKKSATSKSALEACQKSRSLCGSVCVNKACG